MATEAKPYCAMGMHIWYELALPEQFTFDEAREKIADLHRFALTVGFAGADDIPAVGELRWGTDADQAAPTFCVKEKLGNGRVKNTFVPALKWVGFRTLPGVGTESANFGLACYPATYRSTSGANEVFGSEQTIHFDGKVEPDPSPLAEPATELVVGAPPGWSSWQGWCKTQYAHRYGRDHFMRCHLALIKLLDYAKEIGILAEVNDAGGYWESRSADVLLANLHRHDAMVAAFVGQLSDAIAPIAEESGHVMVAPIAGAPDFEHVEAEGREILGAGVLAPELGSQIQSRVRALDVIPGAPIVAWPAVDREGRWPPLSETIDALQRLNPTLDVRVVQDEYGFSYLRHTGSSRDLFYLILPHRASDYLTTALTEYNDRRRRVKVDGKWSYIDATRIERTPTGSLLVRPKTSGVTRAYVEIGKALAAYLGSEFPEKVYPGWCVLPSSDGEEFWEFDWSYWPQTHEVAWKRPDGTSRQNREYWAQLAGGLIGIRDQYDISRRDFEARCEKAVEMGVEWCVLLDQEARDLSVYRAEGVERTTSIEGWTLREIPSMLWQQTWLAPS